MNTPIPVLDYGSVLLLDITTISEQVVSATQSIRKQERKLGAINSTFKRYGRNISKTINRN